MAKYKALCYSNAVKEKTFKGSISVSSRGVGYFHVDENTDDIEIQPENLGTALNRDEVEIVVIPKGQFEREQGKVEKIVKRAKLKFVGTLNKVKEGFFFLKPDDRRMYRDIFVHASKAKGAKEGEKVQVEIMGWKDPSKSPEGKVIKIIGPKGRHSVEMESIILETGFESEFSKEVEHEAEKIVKKAKELESEEIKNRRDMRDTLTFTIDPADAKDFDDALSFKKLGDDKFEIGIHIADVSYYVKEGSKLDDEAKKRGTSVYLVDRTIPMLPEILSNDICSLNPNVDRMVFSAIFEMDLGGKISSRWFGKSVIHSDKRFTYEEAQKIIDDKEGSHFEELNTLNKIAKILREEKFKRGAIDFEADEVRFELDRDGVPVRVYRKERLDTHKLIEEFMLLANREVAFFMTDGGNGYKNPGSFVYRIHDAPDREKIVNLSIFLNALGYELRNKEGEITADELNRVMRAVEGKPEETLVKTASIRSMSKAIYSTKNIGHFGLGFEYYTHFTSPIRRYPDLLVHRLLERYLNKGKVGKDEFAKFEGLCQDASEKEVAAAEAERASIKYKQVEYMQDHVGEEFDATVSGVSEYGVYVEEKTILAEGMVRVRDMTDDYYVLDEKNYCLVGQTNKKKYSLGDNVRVKLVKTDLERKIMDFVFV